MNFKTVANAKTAGRGRKALLIAATLGLGAFGMAAAPALAHEECRPERVWVPARCEDRCTKVWVEPVYRTVCDRVYCEPVYRTTCDRVWCEPVYNTVCETVLAPERCEYVTRRVGYGCNERVVRERVVIEPARYVKHERRVCVAEGHWNNVERRVCVSEGRWNNVERRVLVCAGHFEERSERVVVAPAHWEEGGYGDRREQRERRDDVRVSVGFGLRR